MNQIQKPCPVQIWNIFKLEYNRNLNITENPSNDYNNTTE